MLVGLHCTAGQDLEQENKNGSLDTATLRRVLQKRLGANSFLDLVVFGRQASDTTVEFGPMSLWLNVKTPVNFFGAHYHGAHAEPTVQDTGEVQRTQQFSVGGCSGCQLPISSWMGDKLFEETRQCGALEEHTSLR